MRREWESEELTGGSVPAGSGGHLTGFGAMAKLYAAPS
ncbi:hypothetical protein Aros01_04468 [Streptosporangium roseum]|uniref:Uncharacterized protein n=1 Tax=Streptosporangium roseum (strain ATCC 12428 / DSM 43021 / JCM 3005 / KCTC 9067 / NCIMB 10171 / NRRL 2505 / NI 9100) TaxID=479432 RepID=D2B096_STRRD|nr:hypothetical protein Sros_6385 [Streptosporangium roseum DSM 43021]